MAKKDSRKTTGAGGRRGQSEKEEGERREPSRGEETMGSGGTATATLSITHEQIADRARQIWEQRGCPQGEDERNWREAERQLKKELGAE